MSNLPPKPAFEYSPPRLQSDRRMAPPGSHPPRRSPPPRDRDRDRDRGVYNRSPSRSGRGPPPRMDTYIAGGRESYDRDTYRDRDWERRDREREREYLPGPPDHRYRREHSRERGEWNRERDVDGRRHWDEGASRRGYGRERSPPGRDPRAWTRRSEPGGRYGRDRERGRDDRGGWQPPVPERRWISRASKSPPRRISSNDPRERSRSSRRSPSASTRRRSLTPPNRYDRTRTPSPVGRSSSRNHTEGLLKLGRHSIRDPSGEPRDEGEIETDTGRKRPRDQRSRSRSRSASPPRGGGRPARSPSPKELAKRDEPSEQDVKPSAVILQRMQSPARAASPPKQYADPSPRPTAPEKQEELPILRVETDMDVDRPEQNSTNPPENSRSVHSSKPSPSSSGPTFSRGRRSPPSAPRHYVKTPTTPQSPQPPPSLPPKPERSSREADLSGSTPLLSTKSPAPTTGSPMPLPPRPDLPKGYQGRASITSDINTELARIRSHRTHLGVEYSVIARGERRALHELDMASLDLRSAEKRRIVADTQLDKARTGVLGIDYVHVSQTSSLQEATEENVAAEREAAATV